MLRYMLSLPGVRDLVMEDGTTGFSTALAAKNCDLIKELLGFYARNPSLRIDERERDVALARDAILEPKFNYELKQTLERALSQLPQPTRVIERPRPQPFAE